MTDATWPIRVGGEYRCIFYPNQYKHVTCIDGDTVHFNRMFVDDPEVWRVDSLPTWVFRDMHFPEDQSPLPDLIAALEGVYAGCVNSYDAERLVVNISVKAWKAVEAALAKAKTVPVADEVTV